MNGEKIFICEDSVLMCRHLQNILEDGGYSVVGKAASGEDAIRAVMLAQPDLILMDIILEGEMSGIDAAARIRSITDIPVIYLTALADAETLQSAFSTGPYSYVTKPFDDRDVLMRIEVTLAKHRMEKEMQLLRTSRFIEGQEEERLRISRDLHDSVGQLLTLCKLHLDRCNEQNAAAEKLVIHQLLDSAVLECKRISNNLLPEALLSTPITQAIDNLCNSYCRDGLSIYFQYDSGQTETEPATKIALYRITQEALNNCIKYARASEVVVQLYSMEEGLMLSIEDNGSGFSPESRGSGKGLVNMKFRAESVNGRFLIDSRPGGGTYVSVTVPAKVQVN